MQRVDDETSAVIPDAQGIQIVVTYADATTKEFDFTGWAGLKRGLAAIIDGGTVAALFARDLAVPLPRRAPTPRAERAAIEVTTNG